METNGTESLNQSFKSGKLATLTAIDSIAKSLGTKSVAKEVFEAAKKHPGRVTSRVCHDTEAIQSVKNFLAHHRYFVEPACGAALAATYFPEKYLNDLQIGDGPIVNIICGGNSVSYEMVSFWEENAKS